MEMGTTPPLSAPTNSARASNGLLLGMKKDGDCLLVLNASLSRSIAYREPIPPFSGF